jgi:hypothetical protein
MIAMLRIQLNSNSYFTCLTYKNSALMSSNLNFKKLHFNNWVLLYKCTKSAQQLHLACVFASLMSEPFSTFTPQAHQASSKSLGNLLGFLLPLIITVVFRSASVFLFSFACL